MLRIASQPTLLSVQRLSERTVLLTEEAHRNVFHQDCNHVILTTAEVEKCKFVDPLISQN
jgi:hypothetical protein